MKKLARFLLFSFLALTLLSGALVSYVYWQREAIQRDLIKQLNQQLQAPVNLQDIEISLSKFPMMAFELRGLHSPGSSQLSDTLIAVKSAYLEFKPWDLWRDELPLHRISLEEGLLNLVEKGALNNWSIFKESEDEGSALSFPRVALKRIAFRWRDESNRTSLFVHRMQAKGKSNQAGLNFEGDIKAYADKLVVGEDHYFEALPLAFAGTWQYQQSGEQQNLKLQEFSLNEQLKLKAHWSSEGEKQALVLEALSKDLSQWQGLLRQQDPSIEWPFALSGTGDWQLSWSSQKEEGLKATLQSQELNLNDWGDNPALENLTVDLALHRTENKQDITIKELTSKELGLTLSGELKGLQTYDYTLNCKLLSPVDAWQDWLQQAELKGGKLGYTGQISGRYRENSNWIQNLKLNGKLRLEDLDWERPGYPAWKNIQLSAQAVGHDFKIDTLSLQAGASELMLAGEARHLLSYLSEEGKQGLSLSAHLSSPALNLSDLLPSDQSEQSDERLNLDPQLTLSLSFAIDQIDFHSFHGKFAKGRLDLRDGILSGRKLFVAADSGSYESNFDLQLSHQEAYQLQADFDCQNLSLASVFNSFNNFDQQTLTAQNLEGLASAKGNLQAALLPDFSIIPSSLKLNTDMRIDKGRLRNYAPMQELSNFADLEELADVRFKTLQNTISIQDSRILIPTMTIESSVLDLELNGSHSFENEINYLITLGLGDVLFKKRSADKKQEDEFAEHLQKRERDDAHRIPVRVKGTVDQPIISVEREDLSQSLARDLQKQKEELKNLFKKEEKKKSGTGLIFEWDEDDKL